jgi:hypothetical protein
MQIAAGKGQEYADWKAENADDVYGARIFSYAEDWANLIEKQMCAPESSDWPIEQVIAKYADPLSHLADTDGITGFMYGAAVSVLAKVWIHGDLLRRWHNLKTQIGNEGEKANESGGTLNPALLNIG